MDHRCHKLCACGAKRVPKRYGAAVDVQFLRICIQGLQPSQWNGGEGFVNLIKVDVSDLEASAFQNALGRWDRLFQHHHRVPRSEEHTSELQSLMRISYAVFCLKKKKANEERHTTYSTIKSSIQTH